MAKTEAELIQETREAGKQFLRENPEAFGGGIDPETGIRFVDGQRVSAQPEITVDGVQVTVEDFTAKQEQEARERVRKQELKQEAEVLKGTLQEQIAVSTSDQSRRQKLQSQLFGHAVSMTIGGVKFNRDLARETVEEFETRIRDGSVPVSIRKNLNEFNRFKAEQRFKTEQKLIEETRLAGQQFLEQQPEAFGGGIDPETGIREVIVPVQQDIKPTPTPPPQQEFIGPLQLGAPSIIPPPVDILGAETFVRDAGFNISPSEFSGQATGIITQPTPEEAAIITAAEQKGSIGGILSTVGEFVSGKVGAGVDILRDIPIIKSVRESEFITGIKESETFKALEGVGGTEATGQQQKEFLKEQFPPLKVFEIAAEEIIQVSEKITDSKAPPVIREIAKGILEDVLVVSTFSPLIQTGAAQQTKAKVKLKEKVVKKKKITKKDIQDILLEPNIEGKTVKVIGKGLDDFQIKAARSRELLNAAKSSQAKAEALNIIRDSFGDDFLKEFVKQGELGFIPAISQKSAQIQQQIGPTVVIDVPKIAQIAGIPQTVSLLSAGSIIADKAKVKEVKKDKVEPEVVSFFTPQQPIIKPEAASTDSLLQPSQVGETTFVEGGFLGSILTEKPKEKQETRPDQLPLLEQLPEQDVVQKPKQEQLPLLGQLPGQDTKQEQKQRQEQDTKHEQLLLQLPKQDTKQEQKQKQEQRQEQSLLQVPQQDTRQIQKQVPKQPTGGENLFRQPGRPVQKRPPRRPFILGGLLPMLKKVRRAVKKKREGGFHSEILEGGKWKKVDNISRTESQSTKMSQLAVDKTISAQGRITPSGTPATSVLLNLISRERKFRRHRISGGKKIPLVNQFIEKRKHRLDSKSETQSLNSFKRSAEFGRLTRPKPRKKRAQSRRTQRGINWFS